MGELISLSYKESVSKTADIQLPASKSISNRLLIMQALSNGTISINNISKADDTKILQRALKIDSGEVELGLAGTVLRFGAAWAAITPGERILKGDTRLRKRPIKELVEALIMLGADITYLERDSYAPLKIVGKILKGGKVKINGSRSSQFVTALLLIAPYCAEPVILEIDRKQVSLPYIEMTLRLMQKAGAKISRKDNFIEISGSYEKQDFVVESDWSAASYFYLWSLAIPNSSLTLKNLDFDSLQGDKVAVDFFSNFGIISHSANGDIRIIKKLEAQIPNEINFLSCPDLAQTFAVAATIAKQPIRLSGLQTLRYKETHRIEALKTELSKCGVNCKVGSNFLELIDFRKIDGIPIIKTYNDHRMAMAFAPLTVAFGQIIIENPSVVSKSYPGYWKAVGNIGIQVQSVARVV